MSSPITGLQASTEDRVLAGAQAILGAIGLGAGLYSGWKGVEGAQGVASKNVNATGALTDAEAGALVERGGGGAKGTLNTSLLDELTANGVKFTPENVIATTRNSIGKVVFLETGNSKAGLQHIIRSMVANSLRWAFLRLRFRMW